MDGADALRINQQLMEIEQEIHEEIERVEAAGLVQGQGRAANRNNIDQRMPRYQQQEDGEGAAEENGNRNLNGGDDPDNDDPNNENNGDDGHGDDEEEEVDEEEDDDPNVIMMDPNLDVIDGGVATGKGGDQPASSCNMFLLIECQEQLLNSDHPIYQPNVTVSVGFDKTTRLAAVFHRYVEFANEQNPRMNCPTNVVDMADLEFIHCSVLQPSDTAETAALMKNDRIKVQRLRDKDRKEKAGWIKTQRDSDRDYFANMRHLLLERNPSPLKCDVVFHCQGKIKDDKGYKQEVLTTYVRGHSAILSRRCKWLSNQIWLAKEESDRHHIHHDVGNEHSRRDNNNDHVVERERDDENPPSNVHADDDGDDGIVLQPNHDQNIRGRRGNDNNGANAVEMDDDDDDEQNKVHNIQDVSADESSPSSQLSSSSTSRRRVAEHVMNISGERGAPYIGGNFPDTLCVPLSHPPEAVKLLLEYCYTNRVVPLGQKAFQKSYKPTDLNTVDASMIPHSGPISPFPAPHGLRTAWPNNGMPTVSFPVAIAGMRLAEEANLPRFSLMCEIAASYLVNDATAVEALSVCEQQYGETGNRLRHLRRMVMAHHILGRGVRGGLNNSNYHMSSFKRALSERRDVVVPSLMKGVLETVNDVLGEKRKLSDHNHCSNILSNRKKSTEHKFKGYDEDDALERSQERLKWRKERWAKRPRWNEIEKNPYGLEDDLDFDPGYSRTRGGNYMSVLEMKALDSGKPFIVHGSYADLPGDLTRHSKSSRPRMGRRSKFSSGGGSRTSKGRKRR